MSMQDLQAQQAEWDRKYEDCVRLNRAKADAAGQCRRDLGPRPVADPTSMSPNRPFHPDANPGFQPRSPGPQPRTSPVVTGDATLMQMEKDLVDAGSRYGGSPAYWAFAGRVKAYRERLEKDAEAGNAFTDREDERRLKEKRESQLDADREEAKGDRDYARKQRQASDSQAQNQAQNQARQGPFDNQPTEVIRRMIEDRRTQDNMTDMVRGANEKYDREREKFTQDKETAAKRLAYSPPARPASQPQEPSADAAPMTPEQMQYQNEQAYIKRMLAERERQRRSAGAARPITG